MTDISQIDEDVEYLATSAEDYAKWKARARYLEHYRKSVRAAEILRGRHSSVAANTAQAEASEAYKKVLQDYEEAQHQAILIEAKRHAAETRISVWQTQTKANLRGLI